MKHLLSFIAFFISLFTFAQFAENVLTLDMGVNSIKEMENNLIKGQKFPNSVLKEGLEKCWETKEKELLNGNHLLYALKIPPHAKISISVGSEIDISLYGYLMNKNDFSSPPTFPDKETIERKSSFNVANDFDHPEKLEFETFDIGKNLIVGVCGTKEVTVGDVSIKFHMKSTIDLNNKPSVYKIKAVKDQKTAYKGDLSNGTLMPLDWAISKNTNCFSENQLSEFDGNHIYYIMDLPSNSSAKVTVPSLTNTKINVFGFTGHNGTSLPPNIDEVNSCRASFSRFGNISKQSITLLSKEEDKVLIAIAGANGANIGKYHLIVELKDL